jgi:oxygen-independent coproporphyrinogen-3 oxidase
VDAIGREASLQRSYLRGQTIDTIYFGGGTPSLLNESELGYLFDAVAAGFTLSGNAEITLEANPDDITPELLKIWKNLGINRLSIGIQSFNDKDLIYLNRVHNAERAHRCLTDARDAGFDNLTIDLIFGIPTLDDEGWMRNISLATETGIPHISAYALTVEPKTALDLLIRKGRVAAVDELQAARQFEMLMYALEQKGYLHYEISNYCLLGRYALHNTAYWKGHHYLGLGPSAHSYNGESRQWNVSSLDAYIKGINQQKPDFEVEFLDVSQQYNEYVMTGLRTIWGCNPDDIGSKFGKAYAENFIRNAARWIDRGYVSADSGLYTLTREGKLLADGIAADLFVTGR